MAETKSKARPAAKKPAATRKRPAARKPSEATRAIERSTELSEDVLKSLEDGARSAIGAVRKFVDTVDRTLPPHGDDPSRSKEITDSAWRWRSTWSTRSTSSCSRLWTAQARR